MIDEDVWRSEYKKMKEKLGTTVDYIIQLEKDIKILKDPWVIVKYDTPKEGEVVFVDTYTDQGMGHGYRAYDVMEFINDKFHIDTSVFPSPTIIRWMSIPRRK